MSIDTNSSTEAAIATARPVRTLPLPGAHRAGKIRGVRTIDFIPPRKATAIRSTGSLFPFCFSRKAPADPFTIGCSRLGLIQERGIILIVRMNGIGCKGLGGRFVDRGPAHAGIQTFRKIGIGDLRSIDPVSVQIHSMLWFFIVLWREGQPLSHPSGTRQPAHRLRSHHLSAKSRFARSQRTGGGRLSAV